MHILLSLWWIIYNTVLSQPVLPRLNTTRWRGSWWPKTAGWWSSVDPKLLQGRTSPGAKTPSWSPTLPGDQSLYMVPFLPSIHPSIHPSVNPSIYCLALVRARVAVVVGQVGYSRHPSLLTLTHGALSGPVEQRGNGAVVSRELQRVTLT